MPAGTVVVVRDAVEPRVLMLRRQPSLRILGGFWVFPGGTVDAAEATAAPSERSSRVAAAAAASRELKEEAGLAVAADDLLHFAHWLTPSAGSRRFDTHFFIAAAPIDQEPSVAVAEASELRWVAQREWESAAGSGEFPLAPPTLLVLRELTDALARHGSLEALLAHERNRIVRTVLPKLIDGIAVLPWDPEYGDLPGEGIAWDPAAIAERAGWPPRLAASIGRAPAPS